MTNQEAIQVLKKVPRIGEDGFPNSKLNESIKMAVAALKKQEPMKPTQIDRCNNGLKYGWCPSCPTSQVFETADYCKTCGQALDWTEDEREKQK